MSAIFILTSVLLYRIWAAVYSPVPGKIWKLHCGIWPSGCTHWYEH